MKVLLIIGMMLAGQVSQAATLKCWKTSFKPPKGPKTPFMSATIVRKGVISNLKYHYKQDGEYIKAPEGRVQAEVITTSRSPYKGYFDYDVRNGEEYGFYRLILPTDLSNKNLIKIEKRNKSSENGVLIGDFEGDGAGSHFSVRLSCRSNVK